MKIRYAVPVVCAAFLGAVALAPSTASARDFCLACSYPQYNCVLITSAGFLSCSPQGGGPCLLSGSCEVTELRTQFDVSPDGAVRVGPATSALIASRQSGSGPAAMQTNLQTTSSGGRTFTRACGNVVVARQYSDAAQSLVQAETSTLVI